jgi:hypothetical protein
MLQSYKPKTLMTTKQLILSLAVLWPLGATAEDFRMFSKADGTGSLVAQLVDITTGKDGKKVVSLRRADTKQTVTMPLDLLSDGDKEYVNQEGKVIVAAKSLDISFAPTMVKEAPSSGSGRKMATSKAGYKMKLTNKSTEMLDGVTVNYRLVWKKDVRQSNGMGVKESRREEGTIKLERLYPKTHTEQETKGVELVNDRPNPG